MPWIRTLRLGQKANGGGPTDYIRVYKKPGYVLKRGEKIVKADAATVPVYDADAQKLFTKFATQPDATRKQLISDRFVAGKAKSFWAKLDAIWVHAAHGPEAGRVDWLDRFGDRRYDCLPVNSPVFTVDRGYMGDGVSSYLDTQYNAATASTPRYTQNSGSFGIRSNTENALNGSLAGFFDGSKGSTLNPRAATDAFTGRLNVISPIQVIPASATSVGMFAVSRVASDTVSLFRGGVSLSVQASASVAPANGNMRLGSISNSSFRACQFSMGWIGAGLTDQEAIDLFNWFEPYRIAVGVI